MEGPESAIIFLCPASSDCLQCGGVFAEAFYAGFSCFIAK